MAIVKSELLKELKKSYPNFLTRDLDKILEIILKEIKNALDRDEGVELRGFGTFRTNVQKASIRRNPKTGEKVFVKEKKSVLFKMSKEWAKKINEKE